MNMVESLETFKDVMPKIRIEKKSDKELIFYLETEDKHSLPNLITKLALEKPHVIYSSYSIDHPMVSYPRIAILTDGERDPVDVLVEVLNEAKEYLIKIREIIKEKISERKDL